MQKAHKIGLKIDNYALSHLLGILNNNIALCANELDKLAILNMQITSKDIDKLVYSSSSVATNDLLIDLFEKKAIKETIKKVLEMGEDEFSILRATQYFVTQLFLYQSYIYLNGNLDSKAILGFKLPQDVENRYYRLANSISSQSISNILEYLLDIEILIKKSTPIQREALIFTTLLKIADGDI
jgi:DNA polymerase-3 subunit delta